MGFLNVINSLESKVKICDESHVFNCIDELFPAYDRDALVGHDHVFWWIDDNGDLLQKYNV